jgi:hypothetical protein
MESNEKAENTLRMEIKNHTMRQTNILFLNLEYSD